MPKNTIRADTAKAALKPKLALSINAAGGPNTQAIAIPARMVERKVVLSVKC
ncbi:Uncharacterised protein [Vibrio cholerae]|nr:Uncharacterised protein [Vibrio cholerae]CSH85781.1 Uncharacterised protein [Vibrio cholerae]